MSCVKSWWNMLAVEAPPSASALTLTRDDAVAFPQQMDLDMVAFDEALSELSDLDGQQARIVEPLFLDGLTIEDTSEVMGIFPATLKRDRLPARAWLFRANTGEAMA